MRSAIPDRTESIVFGYLTDFSLALCDRCQVLSVMSTNNQLLLLSSFYCLYGIEGCSKTIRQGTPRRRRQLIGRILMSSYVRGSRLRASVTRNLFVSTISDLCGSTSY